MNFKSATYTCKDAEDVYAPRTAFERLGVSYVACHVSDLHQYIYLSQSVSRCSFLNTQC